MRATMFGSISVSSARCQKDISTSSTAAPAVLTFRPFGCVTLPSISVEQPRDRWGDHIDHVPGGSLPGAVVGGVADHRLRRLSVSAVLARQFGDVGGGVVDDLAAEVLGEVLAVVVIGVEEPMFVCGAIARTSAAWPMTAPAESALEPPGLT